MANKKEKIRIKLIGNDNISPKEEQTLWLQFFNIILKKTIIPKIEDPPEKNKKKVAGGEIKVIN